MMNWKCREFKITKYDSQEDYLNGKISSVESHHGNAITNNGLAAMWILATASSDTNKIDGKTVQPFKPAPSTPTTSTPYSVIAIGKGTTQVTGNETALASQLAVLNVTTITHSQSAGQASITFEGKADTNVATGEWNEWGIYDVENGILFNRKVESMGTKKDNSVWTVEVTIDLVRPSA